MLRSWIFALMLIPLVFGGLRLAENATLNQLRMFWFDSLIRYYPREAPQNSPFAIAAIDEVSLAEIGQWPWPRNKTAALVDALFQNGAAMVVMDINFAHPDRFSPEVLREIFGEVVSIDETIRTDDILAEAIGQGPVVLGSFRSVRGRDAAESGSDTPRAAPLFPAGYVSFGSDPIEHVPLFDDFLDPLTPLASAAYSVASVMVASDVDSVLREVPLIVGAGDGSDFGTELRFFLALEAVRIGLGESQYVIKTTPDDQSLISDFRGVRAIQLGHTDIPVSSNGALRLYESVELGAQVISASDILAGRHGGDVEGKIVFVGVRGIGLGDRATGSMGILRRGIDMQVMAAEQLIAGRYLSIPPAARWIEFALIWGVCILCAIAMTSLVVAQWARMSLSALAVLSPWGLSLAAFTAPFWWDAQAGATQVHMLVDPNAASLAGGITVLIGFAGRVIDSELAKSKLRAQFSRYLSPVVVDSLAKQGADDVMKPATRELSVMFVDVRGFTTMSENLNAEDTVALVNKFLKVISDVVLAHEGTIDKYLGDGAMAFWNAPLSQPAHRESALAAGREIVRRIAVLNAEVQADSYWKDILVGRDIRVGVGLHSGIASVGNFGSEKRVDYSCVGDTVNTAARIESMCKEFNATLLLSEEAIPKDQLKEARLVGEVTLKGRKTPTKLYDFSPEQDC